MIKKEIFEFLEGIKNNNNREWFHANKEKYNFAKTEFETLVNSLISEISIFDSDIENVVAKDCIFRIFKDVRFSKDKTPYKPNFGAYIVRGGKKSGFAGYYLHVEPNMSFLGGGVHMPQSPELKAIREGIFNNVVEFKKIIANKNFSKHFKEFYGEKLKNPPRGFSKEFPDIELLKYKSYIVVHELSDEEILGKSFEKIALDVFKLMKPFNDFINRAIS
ncbi:MAG: DUF2461 domain-containing protein [Bacteroidetes bacterium]|jgi:uncharacterized protein (TIGR02453 family)|nr:DUF2461 domain-containing protein [Bacteroidota bacterium]MBT7142976.1 DUF2461 domain-containing protein [Bacteroidota bacterium]MBT7491727.1 DUF2461 domain-containing protein [Bacteroidota bacterium]